MSQTGLKSAQKMENSRKFPRILKNKNLKSCKKSQNPSEFVDFRGALKYTNFDYSRDGAPKPGSIESLYTSSIVKDQFVPENQTDALKRTTESWPIRALVVGKTVDVGMVENQNVIMVEINTLTFDEKGKVVEGFNPLARKRVGFACNSLFLIDKKNLESSIRGVGIAFSYYAQEQRICHFFPRGGAPINWWTTVGTLEEHRKMLLTRCKSSFHIPLEPDGSNKTQVEEFEKRAPRKTPSLGLER